MRRRFDSVADLGIVSIIGISSHTHSDRTPTGTIVVKRNMYGACGADQVHEDSPTLDIEAQAAFDRAWRHFQLHAEQRIAVFNFFVASSGLLLTGLAYVLAGPAALWKLGIAAGALIALIACVFWKLDERSAQIIKVSEAEIESLERVSTRGPAVFSAVSALPLSTSAWNLKAVWSFGRSFRLMFLAVALLGVSGMGVSIWRGLPAPSTTTADHGNRPTASSSKGDGSAPTPTPSSTADTAPDRRTESRTSTGPSATPTAKVHHR